VLRTRYELGLWCAIRDALRDGRLIRPASRKYLDPAAFLLPPGFRSWRAHGTDFGVWFGFPEPNRVPSGAESVGTRFE